MDSQNDTRSATRGLWVWPIAILLGFPIGGGLAYLAVGGVDAPLSALAGGLIAGLIIGAAQWFVLRHLVSWLWLPATAVGLAAGLVAGSAAVGYRIGHADLVIMGAITGLGVGLLQAMVLLRAGRRLGDALVWAAVVPLAWALGWLVTSYVIIRNVDDRFAVFGASGAIVFGLLTWLMMVVLVRRSVARIDPSPIR